METQYLTITIGRQFGSGGRAIARIIADAFGCKLLDNELLALAAKESGYSEKFFKQTDEHRGFLKSLLHVSLPQVSGQSYYGSEFSEEKLFKLQSDAINKAASEGPCVIVGRCADYVLRENPNLVNIFITANVDERIARVASRHNCDMETAKQIVNRKEQTRASYYNFYTGKKWGDGSSYDLIVNSSHFGIEGTAEFLVAYIKQRLEK